MFPPSKAACAPCLRKRQHKQATPHPTHSTTWRLWSAVLISVFSFQLSAFSQSYSVDWHTVDAGGGTSTGGPMIGINYSVSGTIGQPDAGGPMTNGQYSVTGGFWTLPVVIQAIGAPTLTIVLATPGNATISWSPNPPGYILQETWVLSPAHWTNSLSGATNPVVIPAVPPAKFYRLFKP